uniref:Solute-binding protein family 3/N-terminal domain-containing protein n=1 Tax=OCS116 cluster bacterium TaxID=2030921 RepID=A0A2A4YQH6_9PROT
MTIDISIVKQFSPLGYMRVALNHGNRVLVSRDKNGSAHGISVDLAKELAKNLNVELKFIEYERAIDVSSSAAKNEWDVCFLAVDPERAKTLDFTEPYIGIEGSYLAAAHCDAKDAVALVNSGAKIGSVEGSAYSLNLLRQPVAKNLIMYGNIHAALDALDAQEVVAIAGIANAMQGEANKRAGSRVLHPPFMEIRQAMAMPRGRQLASAFLKQFLADIALKGDVGDILENHGVDRNAAIIPS